MERPEAYKTAPMFRSAAQRREIKLYERNIHIDYPMRDEVWVHTASDKKYTILCMANIGVELERRDKFPPTVVYHNEEGLIFSRPYWSWVNSFEYFRSQDVPTK